MNWLRFASIWGFNLLPPDRVCGIHESMKKAGGGRNNAVIAQIGLCLVAVAAVVAAVLVTNPASTQTENAAAVTAASTVPVTAATPTEAAPTTLPADPQFPHETVNDNDASKALYGWGTAQPTQMKATVHYGGTSTLLSPERRRLLGEQLVQVREAALKIETVAEAEKQGFVRNFQRINGRGFEYINWSRFNTKLDLSRPTMLAFDGDSPDSRVMSVAYNVLGAMADGPPTDLPLEVIPWHYHSNLCEKDNSIVGSVEYDANGNPYPEQAQRCKDLGAVFRPELNHWMVDLWVIPGWENPWGLVSSKHPDMMFEPTPWFTSNKTGEVDGFGLYCDIPAGADPAPASTPS